MTGILIQLLLIIVWSVALTIHGRRLFRLAVVPAIADRRRYLRQKAERMWWWLGRDEFWREMQNDTFRCIQLSFMVLILAWQM